MSLDRALERIAKSEKPWGCWEWTGTRDNKGYGVLKVERQMHKAHRVVYELLVGPIPDGLHIDHLCLNPGCVKPDHLEPVTGAENTRRARAYQARKVVCPEGHLMVGTNLRLVRSAAGEPCASCRECFNRRHRAGQYSRKRREAQRAVIGYAVIM